MYFDRELKYINFMSQNKYVFNILNFIHLWDANQNPVSITYSQSNALTTSPRGMRSEKSF
jgi:hypothetical protein